MDCVLCAVYLPAYTGEYWQYVHFPRLRVTRVTFIEGGGLPGGSAGTPLIVSDLPTIESCILGD